MCDLLYVLYINYYLYYFLPPPSVIRETGMMILMRVDEEEPLGQRLSNYQVPFPEAVKNTIP
jgi:hypothetical protein